MEIVDDAVVGTEVRRCTVDELDRRQFIEILPFQGSGQLKFWPKKGAKKPQKVDFCAKMVAGSLFNF